MKRKDLTSHRKNERKRKEWMKWWIVFLSLSRRARKYCSRTTKIICIVNRNIAVEADTKPSVVEHRLSPRKHSRMFIETRLSWGEQVYQDVRYVRLKSHCHIQKLNSKMLEILNMVKQYLQIILFILKHGIPEWMAHQPKSSFICRLQHQTRAKLHIQLKKTIPISWTCIIL